MSNRMKNRWRRLNTLELIGMEVEVVDHSDPTLVGKSGVVLDETKNTFLLEEGGVKKRVSKREGRFRFLLREGQKNRAVTVDGDLILFRPENRTKRCQRKPLTRD